MSQTKVGVDVLGEELTGGHEVLEAATHDLSTSSSDIRPRSIPPAGARRFYEMAGTDDRGKIASTGEGATPEARRL